MDRVYFDSPISPAGQDWMHCEVRSTANNVLRVTVQVGYGPETTMEFPMARVQRIEYGSSRR